MGSDLRTSSSKIPSDDKNKNVGLWVRHGLWLTIRLMASHSHSGIYQFLSSYIVIIQNGFNIAGIIQLWKKVLSLVKPMEEFATNSKIHSIPRNLPRVQWEFSHYWRAIPLLVLYVLVLQLLCLELNHILLHILCFAVGL